MPYTSVDGTAAIGTDYTDPDGGTNTTGTVTFQPGAREADLVIPTLLNANSISDETFDLALDAIAQARVANGTGVGTVRKISADLTIFNPDGTSGDGTLMDGDFAPMEARLPGDATASGRFSLDYDPTYFKVTTDQAGDDVINPGDPIAPTTAGTIYYLWGESPIGAIAPDISIDYREPASAGGALFDIAPEAVAVKKWQLLWNGSDINAQHESAQVGQQMVLEVVGVGKYETSWAVPSGKVVDGYDETLDSEQLADLSPDDLCTADHTLTFCWSDGGAQPRGKRRGANCPGASGARAVGVVRRATTKRDGHGHHHPSTTK